MHNYMHQAISFHNVDSKGVGPRQFHKNGVFLIKKQTGKKIVLKINIIS